MKVARVDELIVWILLSCGVIISNVSAQMIVLPPVAEEFKAYPVDSGMARSIMDDTFELHSRPQATKTIYLDFDGHDGLGGYDFDGNPNSFSDSERQEIRRAWARAAEDFSPFNVNVTTEEPRLDALINEGGGDHEWGVRVVIHPGAGTSGGWAFVGSFTWDSDQPCFVDTNGVGTGAKNVAEVISHEVGHTLGLGHDGQFDSEYYGGHGAGSTGWAPIMGVGYYQPVTQWSRGEYTGATNGQDDLAVITSGNGFGYRVDDHGNDLSGATAANHFAGIVVHHEGVIERSTDTDYFTFSKIDDGAVSFTISPAEHGPNLDIEAAILDGTGAVLATSNPANRLDAEFDLDLPPGDYFVRIDGVGTGNPSLGYSDYGSLGQYEITGNVMSDLAGDLNADGLVNQDDIDAFVAGWRTTGHATVQEQVMHGDLNLDGTTDLADWHLFRVGFNMSSNAGLLVPEPSLGWLGLAMAPLWYFTSRRRDSLR